MSWVRIDDQAPRNTKLVRAGPAACWLWVCGIAHSQSQLTNGFISLHILSMLGVKGVQRTNRLAKQLVSAGLFEKVEGGYMIHDYLEYNQAKAAVLQERAIDSLRKTEARMSRGEARNRLGFPRESTGPIPSHPVRTKKELANTKDSVPTDQQADLNKGNGNQQQVSTTETFLASKKAQYGRRKTHGRL